VQHLWTLESAYEVAFREAQMDGEDSIRTYLQSVGCRGLYQDLIYNKITAHYTHAPEKLAEENIERYRTAGPAGQADFSVQVYTDEKSMVKEMNVEEHGKGDECRRACSNLAWHFTG